ncbi:hypothetical protein JTE90_011730 [Oedothorax gibbosus]|uniref:Uncharacterized protein n=1 Tax=Oedothorax gibbosus TaxID=931172 RepID=A0AAV6TU30_9ARAC|nr:hypothetical protein JTE90_011730 [Oedothorax gibbosus]
MGNCPAHRVLPVLALEGRARGNQPRRRHGDSRIHGGGQEGPGHNSTQQQMADIYIEEADEQNHNTRACIHRMNDVCRQAEREETVQALNPRLRSFEITAV